MLARLALLFVVVPLLELILLIEVGQVVGLWPTIALVVGTGAAGAALARAQGLKTLWAFQKSSASGQLPSKALQDGLAILVGGAFLLTPGLLTDLAGFLLLIPGTRAWIQRRVRKALVRRIADGRIQVAMMTPNPFGAGAGPFHADPEPLVQDAEVIDSEPPTRR